MFYGLEDVGLCERPVWVGNRGLRGSRAKGLTFERKVGKILSAIWPQTQSGQWLRFRDWAGPGCCQPDHFVRLDGWTLVVECKLTESAAAWEQLAKYSAVLERLYGVPVARVQACKRLRWTRDVVTDPRYVRPGEVRVWHTLGV